MALLEALLRRGKSQAECTTWVGVSVRTKGRAVARITATSKRC